MTCENTICFKGDRLLACIGFFIELHKPGGEEWPEANGHVYQGQEGRFPWTSYGWGWACPWV